MTRDNKTSEVDAVVEKQPDSAVEQPNSNSNREPAVDFQGAMQRLGGDKQLFLEFVQILREDGPVLIKKIETAIENSDSKQLEHSAHALKGLVSNFGASDCVADALLLEQAGRSGDFTDATEPFQRLIENHEQLLCELKTFAQ